MFLFVVAASRSHSLFDEFCGRWRSYFLRVVSAFVRATHHANLRAPRASSKLTTWRRIEEETMRNYFPRIERKSEGAPFRLHSCGENYTAPPPHSPLLLCPSTVTRPRPSRHVHDDAHRSPRSHLRHRRHRNFCCRAWRR